MQFWGVVRRTRLTRNICTKFGNSARQKPSFVMSLPPEHNSLELRLPCTEDPFIQGVDEVIDVRTPLEYAEDHIPGAINLPVLTNSERHTVGKEYASNSFEARKNGAALISSNISTIIRDHFVDKPKSHSVLVYCWRGGQRSKSLAVVLSMIGYNVRHLTGGYKTYRSKVVSELSEHPSKFHYKVIGGMTGCGKTLLLQMLEDAGEQVLDLEGLANHKGSVLGICSKDGNQPSTRMFESCLLKKFRTFDPSLPVWVEAEGRRIGDLQIPGSVFDQMTRNVVESYIIKSPIQMRVKYTMTEYEYFTKNTTELKKKLERLSKLNAPLKRWYKLIDDGKFEEFVQDMLETHYDPMYKKSHGKSFARAIKQGDRIEINLDKIDKKFLLGVVPELLTHRCISSSNAG